MEPTLLYIVTCIIKVAPVDDFIKKSQSQKVVSSLKYLQETLRLEIQGALERKIRFFNHVQFQ